MQGEQSRSPMTALKELQRQFVAAMICQSSWRELKSVTDLEDWTEGCVLWYASADYEEVTEVEWTRRRNHIGSANLVVDMILENWRHDWKGGSAKTTETSALVAHWGHRQQRLGEVKRRLNWMESQVFAQARAERLEGTNGSVHGRRAQLESEGIAVRSKHAEEEKGGGYEQPGYEGMGMA